MPTPITPHASERSPDTIVLVHGFWVTPRGWEHWIPHYEAKGYRFAIGRILPSRRS